MKIALDTNRYRDLTSGDLALAALLEEVETVFLPIIVLAELRAGFSVGKRGLENERILQRFLGKPGVEVLLPSAATTHFYALLYKHLRDQGTPIPTNDLWIAALAVERDLPLCSRDGHFRNLPQLRLI